MQKAQFNELSRFYTHLYMVEQKYSADIKKPEDIVKINNEAINNYISSHKTNQPIKYNIYKSQNKFK